MPVPMPMRPLFLSLLPLSLGLSAAHAQVADPCTKMGGDMIFALEAKVPTTDQHVSNAAATRHITMGMFEALMTRDENMAPMLGLAQSMEESADGLTFTFKLRPGVVFHNGKTMTSADVAASFDRFKRIGIDKTTLASVDRWETPDAETFVLKLTAPQATFIETLSGFTTPIVIIPSENAGAEPNRLPLVGTGPFQMVEAVADSHYKLKRFDGYKADMRAPGTNGFGGYKKVCIDTVTYRMIIEPQARVAALETGEVHGVEDVPTVSQKRLAQNANIKLMPLQDFWLHVAYPNMSAPPTDNLKFRQAVQAALDAEEIMVAASDGDFRLSHAYQFPPSAYYSDAGKELHNQKNPAKAKQLLAESGYRGEKVVLLTNRDYTNMYNAAVVMAEQMKAVGINAELLVLDWPAALQKSLQWTQDWNFMFSGWTTVIAQGGLQSLRFMADPNNVHRPKDNKSDPQFMALWQGGLQARTLDERKAAFAAAQRRAHEEVMSLPFGILPKVAAVRSNIDGFKPYFVIRSWNVSMR